MDYLCSPHLPLILLTSFFTFHFEVIRVTGSWKSDRMAIYICFTWFLLVAATCVTVERYQSQKVRRLTWIQSHQPYWGFTSLTWTDLHVCFLSRFTTRADSSISTKIFIFLSLDVHTQPSFPPISNFWQPIICLLLLYFCHLRMFYKWNNQWRAFKIEFFFFHSAQCSWDPSKLLHVSGCREFPGGPVAKTVRYITWSSPEKQNQEDLHI